MGHPVDPVGAGRVPDLPFTSQGWGCLFPYSLLCLGMRANNPQLELDTLFFLASCAAYTALFSLLSIRAMGRWDVTTG